ncbi:hypothetical protein [Rhodanobacter sp. DHB23]|uniref:hypothetical protein n=1 Tax=Rhodanobacter sp. DHB23 TaxID=2775923 RepID=UPI001785423D|nr:hypothetical protein [Rhodanobacter sp. DHB23]MBD8871605.1 hypothetical protein [Rhodanobacter sp. DHB23]
MRNTLIVLAVAGVLGTLSTGAHAQDALSDIFSQGTVNGELRVYDFNRSYDYETAAKPSAHAFGGSILLNAQTGSLDGFSAGVSLISANSLGSLSNNPKRVDTTLMGASDSLTALGQAYLQYKNDWVTLRAGDQYLNTPWMGNSDGRLLPNSYEALTVDLTPVKGWDIIGIRELSYKSRTSSDYFDDNNYYPNNYQGDTLYGGNQGLPLTAKQTSGTWVLGTTYASGGLKVQGWYYDFLDFTNMAYADGSYVFKTGTGFDPVIGLQGLTENGGGSDNVLVANQLKINGVAGHNVRSDVWGADLGVIIPNGRFDVYYNKVDQQNGSVGDGSIISPFTASYATDPLYTSSMIRGLVEAGPGSAWKAKMTYGFFDNKLQLVGSYARYTTDLNGDFHDTYFDVIYNFDGYLKGLQIRDRWEKSVGGLNNLNPGNKPFTYNRVMLTYKF